MAVEALRGLRCALEPRRSFSPGRVGDTATPAAAASSYVVPALRAGQPRRGQGKGRTGGARGEAVEERGGE